MDHVQSVAVDLLIRDPLTGAYSRGLLQDRFQEELARAEREISPLVVCSFDLDGFDQLDLQHGPEVTDPVLQETVRRPTSPSGFLTCCFDRNMEALWCCCLPPTGIRRWWCASASSSRWASPCPVNFPCRSRSAWGWPPIQKTEIPPPPCWDGHAAA